MRRETLALIVYGVRVSLRILALDGVLHRIFISGAHRDSLFPGRLAGHFGLSSIQLEIADPRASRIVADFLLLAEGNSASQQQEQNHQSFHKDLLVVRRRLDACEEDVSRRSGE